MENLAGKIKKRIAELEESAEELTKESRKYWDLYHKGIYEVNIGFNVTTKELAKARNDLASKCLFAIDQLKSLLEE